MKPTQQLHDLGQSLWLDHISRDLLDAGTLARYIEAWSVTGLTSNPTIFDEALGNSRAYDDALRGARASHSDEALFTELALEDLRWAADLLRPVHVASGGIDGWVSMEVSPLLANDSAGTIAAAAHIFEQAGRSNLFVKIPGTRPGLAAIEQSVFAGVPVNVTLLFSRGQYLAAADAYLRGIERRVQAGLDANVASVASLFVSRWDRATVDAAPQLRNRLGVAIASDVYHAYGELLSTPRWRQLAAHGARPQRLLWASTGTKGASERDTMYIEALAAPDTIITLPEKTLIAFADHGQSGYSTIADHAAAQETIQCFARAGVDVGTLALRLQIDGTRAFAKSWESLMQRVAAKRTAVPAAMCRP